MNILLFVVLLAHGLIHLIGVVKAFRFAEITQISRTITKKEGILWLAAAALFIVAAIAELTHIRIWWIPASVGLLISQMVIIRSWKDAKFGSLITIILIIPIAIGIARSLPSGSLNRFRNEVRSALVHATADTLLSDQDIAHLPAPIQKYIRLTGAIGKPRVKNFHAVFTGQIRSSEQSRWMDYRAEQYTTFDRPARIFYIESSMMGIPFDGLHQYKDTISVMKILAASLFPVVDASGPKMFQSETVTFFNDMCVMAPATLIDRNIQWIPIDSLHVKAVFTNRGQSVSAVLSFNSAGELIDFSSEDRFQSTDGKSYNQYRWTTPMREYRTLDGRAVATQGEALWHPTGSSFPYVTFNLQSIRYNVVR